MAWTRHGYWFGPLPEPKEDPPLRARCGGPGMCIECMRQAYQATVDELAQRRKQVGVLTEIATRLVPLWDAEKDKEPERYREPMELRLEFYASEFEDLRAQPRATAADMAPFIKGIGHD